MTLAQVNEVLAKMPNREVLDWLEALRVDKWNRLAKDPPIHMTADNLAIKSPQAPVSEDPDALYNLINADEGISANTVTWNNADFDVDYKFMDEKTRRVTGFFIKSGPNNHVSLSPGEVTVSWDNELSKPTKSTTFELNFTDEDQELYFDLPDMDASFLKFSFKNESPETQINQIELFGPDQDAIDLAETEIANGEFVTEEWWVYGEATGAEADASGEVALQCVRASRTTTTSGWYVESGVMDVPKAECCRVGNAMDETRLDRE